MINSFIKSAKKHAVKANIIMILCVFVLIFAFSVLSVVTAESAPSETASSVQNEESSSSNVGLGLIGAALATGLSGIGAGIAVASSASAAIGAISENPKVFGQALIFVALAEGIALYGLIISIQILAKI